MLGETDRRLGELASHAENDGLTPQQFVLAKLRQSALAGNPFVNLDQPFIVVGVDGISGKLFPCGSIDTVEDARSFAQQKTKEEVYFSDGEAVATTFHIYTNRGVSIPLEDPEQAA